MFPPDPIRQKMLFKTEWKSVLARFGTETELDAEMNDAFKQLADTGFSVHQILPAPTGMLVIGQKVSSPVADPTPQGVPVPGTNAIQDLQVVYSFIEGGTHQTLKMKSLREAVTAAVADLEASSRGGARQPMSIHVVSSTTYGPGDLHVLRAQV